MMENGYTEESSKRGNYKEESWMEDTCMHDPKNNAVNDLVTVLTIPLSPCYSVVDHWTMQPNIYTHEPQSD